jgi:lipopolysaccharide transport system permease protein
VTAPATPSSKPFLTIERRTGWIPLDLPEIWRFRDLLLTLAGRDIRLRYRQTLIGVAWVLLQPLITAGIFSFVFGIIAHLPSQGVPYLLLSYTGTLAYNVFSNTLSKASACLVGNSHLVSKVYFPRIVLPLSTAVSSLLDFVVCLVVLPFLMAIYHVHFGWQALLLPCWIAFILMLALGLGLFGAALTVSYRDVQYILPVALQMVFFASPVGYAVTTVPHRFLGLYFLNPLASLIEAFRWSCIKTGDLHVGYLAYSMAFSLVALLLGSVAFRRMERKFADVI